MARGKARVLVVDDHPLIRQALADLINYEPDLVCCGVARDIPEARLAASLLNPDVVTVDLRLGQADGLELVKALHSDFAGLRILVLSELEASVFAESALLAGAQGYLMKEQAADQIMEAIRAILAGGTYLSQNQQPPTPFFQSTFPNH